MGTRALAAILALGVLAFVGDGFGATAVATPTDGAAGPQVQVTVTATLPLVGLIGIPGALEVTAHAPRESSD